MTSASDLADDWFSADGCGLSDSLCHCLDGEIKSYGDRVYSALAAVSTRHIWPRPSRMSKVTCLTVTVFDLCFPAARFIDMEAQEVHTAVVPSGQTLRHLASRVCVLWCLSEWVRGIIKRRQNSAT